MRRVFVSCSLAIALAASLPLASARADWFAAQVDLTDEYLTGRFDPTRHPRFTKATPAGGFLHKVALGAFAQMRAAALKAGFKLRIVSPARNFDAQKRIWEAKWYANRAILDERKRALAILTQSSMPGTSRHHWGTDIDVGHGYCGDAACLEAPAWQGRTYAWMVANAHRFGFCQPFHASRTGYAFGYREERWHWSFHPLARLVLAAYEQRIDPLAPKAGSFLGAQAGAALYKDFVRNVGCSSETRAMVREAMSAIGAPLSPAQPPR